MLDTWPLHGTTRCHKHEPLAEPVSTQGKVLFCPNPLGNHLVPQKKKVCSPVRSPPLPGPLTLTQLSSPTSYSPFLLSRAPSPNRAGSQLTHQASPTQGLLGRKRLSQALTSRLFGAHAFFPLFFIFLPFSANTGSTQGQTSRLIKGLPGQ